jgi:PqqD family protein of HPr-rel-A system
MDTTSSLRWKAPAHHELLWEEWEREFVVFDPRSGHTHLLNEMAAASLQALASHSLDAEELTRFLALEFGVAENEALARHVADMLAHFDDIGLIEPDL